MAPERIRRALRLRAAVPADLPRLSELAERLADFGPPAWRTSGEIVEGELRTVRRHLESPAPDAALVVAADGAEAVGFVYVETLTDYFTGLRHGHIGILSVAKEAEGTGVGGALLGFAEDWARQRGYAILTLNVFDGNRRARSVYERRGYAPETLRYVKALG